VRGKSFHLNRRFLKIPFPNTETAVPGLDKNNVINIAQTRFQLAPLKSFLPGAQLPVSPNARPAPAAIAAAGVTIARLDELLGANI
jgi:hypothetical protein